MLPVVELLCVLVPFRRSVSGGAVCCSVVIEFAPSQCCLEPGLSSPHSHGVPASCHAVCVLLCALASLSDACLSRSFS